MRYNDGNLISLGDIVTVPVLSGVARARVVMLGDTYEHLDLDAQFLTWVNADKVLRRDSVVVEWIGANPVAHNDINYAPVGNYMFSPVDEFLRREN